MPKAFNFAITFKPTNLKNRYAALGQDYIKEGDSVLKSIRKIIQHEMQRAAPGPAMQGRLGPLPQKFSPNLKPAPYRLPRSGRLRRSIQPTPFAKSGGGLDKKVNLQVEARSPHAKFVIGGVRPNKGEGGKGRGAFFPGVRKRGRYGMYPGFAAYDFVEEAKKEILKVIPGTQTKFLKTMTRKFKGRLRGG